MRAVLALIAIALIAVGVLAATGRGPFAEEEEDDRGPAKGSVAVYASLPLDAADQPVVGPLQDGMNQALEEVGNRAGDWKVKLTTLDASARLDGRWNAKRVAFNARKAADDPRAMAYVGEFNSGAAEIAIPILNRAGLGMVSPSATADGLTSIPANNFVRLAPTDEEEGRKLAGLVREENCRDVRVESAPGDYSAGVEKGLGEVPGSGNGDPDCVVFTGVATGAAGRRLSDLARSLPDAKLFAGQGANDPSFLERPEAKRFTITAPILPLAKYPKKGQELLDRQRADNADLRTNGYYVAGYEAMQLVLRAIARGGDDREAVRAALLATGRRDSVLGPYVVGENGETGVETIGVYGVEDAVLSAR